MNHKQKLELTWIGKEHRPKLEPRILLEDPEKSYHAAHRVTEHDCFDNRLIFGDNLLALKALEAEFAGKVKCVFIDPPYNTGSAFTHYDDGLEHSIWLSMMRDRLEIIRKLLSKNGSLWITVDDNESHYLYYPIIHPVTRDEIYPSESRVWGYDQKKHLEHVENNLIWWGANGEKDKPRLKSFLSKVGTGIVPDTLWFRSDVGDNQDAKREARAFNSIQTFETPKPEKLLGKILEIATNLGDLILDSFAGSGTTGAVAHKMGRRWIMIELGEHCHTHIIPRRQKVINGEDNGGITQTVNWQGGGGFRYYRLAPSLLQQDKWGNWVINKTYNPAMLTEALCKLEGFTYAPSDTFYWQQGYSTERDFIYITTQNLSHDQLAQLSDEVGTDRTLLVLCMAFRGKADKFANLTVKKIPKQVLSRCEWGHDDYSLKVENLPKAPVKPGQMELNL